MHARGHSEETLALLPRLQRKNRISKQALRGISAVSDRLDGAAFHSFLTLNFLFRRRWLLIDERKTAIIVPREIIRRGLSAKITVNTLVIDEIFALRVVRVPVCGVSHKYLFEVVFLSLSMGLACPLIKPHLS